MLVKPWLAKQRGRRREKGCVWWSEIWDRSASTGGWIYIGSTCSCLPGVVGEFENEVVLLQARKKIKKRVGTGGVRTCCPQFRAEESMLRYQFLLLTTKLIHE